MLADVLDDALRERKELRVSAARKKADAEALAEGDVVPLHLLENSGGRAVPSEGMELDQGLIGGVRQRGGVHGADECLGLAGRIIITSAPDEHNFSPYFQLWVRTRT